MAKVHFVQFVLPGRPQRWRRTGGFGKRRYEPTEQKSTKATIQVLALQAIGKLRESWPQDLMYRLRVDAYWDVPTTRHRKRDPVRMRPNPIASSDWDNIGKLIGDALEGICWANDKQIVDGRTLKWEANQGEGPRTVVSIWGLGCDDEWRDIIGRD